MKALKIRYLIIALIIILSLLVSSCSLSTTDNSAPPDTSSPSSNILIDPGWTVPAIDGEALALPSIADVVALVKPSVVAINPEYVSYDIFNRPYEQQGAGSGWIIDEDGLIVTNNHVVEGAESITVTLDDGNTYTADTNSIFTDSLNDIAIIK